MPHVMTRRNLHFFYSLANDTLGKLELHSERSRLHATSARAAILLLVVLPRWPLPLTLSDALSLLEVLTCLFIAGFVPVLPSASEAAAIEVRVGEVHSDIESVPKPTTSSA